MFVADVTPEAGMSNGQWVMLSAEVILSVGEAAVEAPGDGGPCMGVVTAMLLALDKAKFADACIPSGAVHGWPEVFGADAEVDFMFPELAKEVCVGALTGEVRGVARSGGVCCVDVVGTEGHALGARPANEFRWVAVMVCAVRGARSAMVDANVKLLEAVTPGPRR
jgi:hypothetical protein